MTPNEKLQRALEKPIGIDNVTPRSDGAYYGEDAFNPWNDLFDGFIFGSYSSDFDECAISVLENIRSRRFNVDTLAQNIIKEMLCSFGYCNYGSSPRVCFWDCDDELLELLIDKWKKFHEYYWMN